MAVTWGQRWQSIWTNSSRLKTGWLIAAGIVALYVGAIRPYQLQQRISNSRETGLSESAGMWRQMGYNAVDHAVIRQEPVAGGGGGIADKVAAPRMRASLSASMSADASPQSDQNATDR